MKTATIFMFALALAFVTANAAMKVEKKSVQSNSMKASFISGQINLTSVTEKNNFCQMFAYMCTRSSWYSLQSKAAKTKFDNPEKNTWIFQGELPADKKGAVLNVVQTIKAGSGDKLDISYTWKTPDMKNLTEFFFWARLDMKMVAGKKIYINDKPVTVENITKYGWFRGRYDKVRLDFFKGDPKHEFSIYCEKCSLVFESSKGKNVNVRFYPQSRDGGKMQLTVELSGKNEKGDKLKK